jgi:hypothetical protein
MSDNDRRILAARGEFIRRRVRDLTLGLATMNKMDVNFFMNKGALDRRISKLEKDLYHDLAKSAESNLVSPDAVKEPKFLKALADKRPQAREILALSAKRDVLKEYYNFYLETQKEYPNDGFYKLIFGIDKKNQRENSPGFLYPYLKESRVDENFPADQADEKSWEILEPPSEEAPAPAPAQEDFNFEGEE